MKKVLLFVIDALATRIVKPALQANQLPNLQQLIDAGHLHDECISIFPSITPAALSSIITGQYPDQHGIAGAHFFDPKSKSVAYYGEDFWVILQEGLGNFVRDFLHNLNHDRLSAPTLFEQVEAAGIASACLNFFIYKGKTPHTVNPSVLLKALGSLDDVGFGEQVYGASVLHLGDLVSAVDEGATKLVGHPQQRFGFHDDITAQVLLDLIAQDALPPLTVAYFPNNDFDSHADSPADALSTLQHFDDKLGEIVAALGGLEQALQEYAILIVGDHSQSDMQQDEEAVRIDLEAHLSEFQQAAPGQVWQSEDQIMICPNLRMAQIYLHYPSQTYVDYLVEVLLKEPRIDQVMWRDQLLYDDQQGYHVHTTYRGTLRFWHADKHEPPHAKDVYGTGWCWEGDLATVDGRVAGGVITFGEYPNAFERIKNGLDLEISGHVHITARIGHEFGLSTTDVHTAGGSHGSLHLGDSVVPLITAGLPDGINNPQNPRTVDVAPLCLSILGIQSAVQIGHARV